MINAIDPSEVKTTQKNQPLVTGQQDFSAFMGAEALAGREATTQSGGSPEQAGVTHAAMTGLAGAAGTGSYPYLGIASPVGIASPGPIGGGQTYPTTGPAVGGGTTAANGLPFSNPSQDFLEKDYLLKQMQDSSMNMLMLQSQVQDETRNFTLVSNMLQSRDRALHNIVQNIRGM